MRVFSLGLVLRSVVSCRPLSGIGPSLQGMLRRELKHPLQTVNSTPAPGYRHLFSARALGMDEFLISREKGEVKTEIDKEVLRKQMKKNISDPDSIIYVQDFKDIIHFAEGTEDLMLIRDIIKRFNDQSKGSRFAQYIFGPVIMRLFHYLDQPEEALELIKDTELKQFFNQLSSYRVALDLLYENERYTDVIDVWEMLKERRVNDKEYHPQLLIYPIASWYQMNTPESFEMTMSFLKEVEGNGIYGILNGKITAAALAQRQGYPHVCLEILSHVNVVNDTIIENLRIISLAEMGKAEVALSHLQLILQTNEADDRCRICRDIIEKVLCVIEETDNKEHIAELQQIVRNLGLKRIITYKTLDESLPINKNRRRLRSELK